jgi:hypothetical protein
MELADCKPRIGVRSRRRRPVLLGPLLIAVALATATYAPRASAWCRTTVCPTCVEENGCPSGTPLFWPSSCVTYSMHYLASKQIDLPTATSVMDRAFAVWMETSCPEGGPPAIKVDRRFGNVACTLHEYNQTDANANAILFRDDVWPYESASNVLGLTTVTYSRKTGAIFDVDMEINATHRLSADDTVPPNSYDLQSIATHEAGHFLGLAHSTDRSATMTPQYTSGTDSFRMLAEDDIGGICSVYPPNSPSACDPNPRQGFSPTCGIFPSGDGGKCSVARVDAARDGDRRYRWLELLALIGAVALAGRRVRRD